MHIFELTHFTPLKFVFVSIVPSIEAYSIFAFFKSILKASLVNAKYRSDAQLFSGDPRNCWLTEI
ncbi:hypothetical protein MHK_010119 [Candidatus Magnetomorum sp. HK-1]|nr:hypothetical protein MHK_010119 [Candidatus Magnetomorum sp. HK-1]